MIFPQETLSTVQDLLIGEYLNEDQVQENGLPENRVTFSDIKMVTHDQLVTGALEAAFHAMVGRSCWKKGKKRLTKRCTKHRTILCILSCVHVCMYMCI